MTPQRIVHVPTDAFTRHLSDCVSGCDVKLDGTGPLCPEGQRVMETVDWPSLSRLHDRATTEINRRMDDRIRELAADVLARLGLGS